MTDAGQESSMAKPLEGIRVLDLTGRELINTNRDVSGSFTEQIDISAFRNGSYIVKLTADDFSSSRMIVKH